MTFFATQNPTSVSIVLASFKWDNVPLYLVVILSLLLGLLIAWLFGLLSSLSSSITIFGKDVKIKKEKQTVAQLNNRVAELETENAKLNEKLNQP